MVPSTSSRRSNVPFYGRLFCSLIIVLAGIVIQVRQSPPLDQYLSKEISPKKPYGSFDEFYPHYLDEHSLKITRQWHYVGTSLFLLYLVLNPVLAMPMLAGALAAYASMPFFRHLSTGIFEAGLFLMIYLIGARLLTRSFKKTLLPLLIGYGFAWVGHFFFEHNKPATFIYPTYSLMGDFRMIFDAIKGQLSALA